MRPGVTSAVPAGEHELLVRAAILEGDAGRAAWAAWRSAVDLDRIDHASFRLVPLLYRNVERLGVDDPLVGRLRGIYRRAWVENHLLLRRAEGVLTALSAAGVETAVLKGLALATQAYGDLGARPMADVDLLVRPRDFGAAVAAIRAAGWTSGRVTGGAWDTAPETFHDEWGSVSFRQERDALNVLDLHSTVFRLYADRPVPFPTERLFEDSEACLVGSVPARRLGPGHALLHVLFHGLQSQTMPTIRWVPDAHLLLRARGKDVRWGPLFSEARRRRVIAPLREGLPLLAARYGTPVPAPVLRALRQTRLSLVERVEVPLRHGSSKASHDFGRTVSPFLRSAVTRTPGVPLPLRPLPVLRDLWRVSVRLPVKHFLRAPLDRLITRRGRRRIGD